MENTPVIINLPKKYLEAIEFVIKTFPVETTIEEYLLECVRCGLEADDSEFFEYYEQMQSEQTSIL